MSKNQNSSANAVGVPLTIDRTLKREKDRILKGIKLPKDQDLQSKIQPLHEAVVVYAAVGLPKKRIAELTGYSVEQIGRILRSELVKLRFSEIRKEFTEQALDVSEILQRHAPSAAMVMVEEMNTASSSKDRQSAAKDILDRSGHSVVQRSVNVHMDYSDLVREVDEEIAIDVAYEESVTSPDGEVKND